LQLTTLPYVQTRHTWQFLMVERRETVAFIKGSLTKNLLFLYICP
jgi:hypothetical protein